MEKLVLHPTDTSQWHALVNEAQCKLACHLTEDLESYLVFLLMRFSQQPQLASSVLAMDFLESLKTSGQVRYENLRDVGDKSLLFSGLFPGLATRRRVNIDYFIDMGQTAYACISDMQDHSVARLFANLCDGFIVMKDVLDAMRQCDSEMASGVVFFSQAHVERPQ